MQMWQTEEGMDQFWGSGLTAKGTRQPLRCTHTSTQFKVSVRQKVAPFGAIISFKFQKKVDGF